VFPRVSISISSHNYEKYLGNAIESALAQTYPEVEVVVVDDGSTDRSRDIIATFGGRIRAVFQENQGITAACNTGFATTNGDIVLFLDADDLLVPNAIEKVVGAWSPGVIKVQFPLAIIDGAGRSSGAVAPLFPNGYGPQDVRRSFLSTANYSWPTTSGNAYARGFLETLLPLPVELFPYAPDGAINTVAPLYGDIVTIPEILGSYRIHGANHWALQTVVPAKFGAYINQKQKEMAFLRDHAARHGVALPKEDPLDRSLTYLEYRLSALKLHQPYASAASDKAGRLLRLAVREILRSDLSFSRKATLLVWSLALAASRGRTARTLVDLRYDSSTRSEGLNHALSWLRVLQRPRTAKLDGTR
jgi:glycosyltransferase involved in cell wall biosynthesis